MNLSKVLFLLCFLFLLLAGCNSSINESETLGNPTPKDFLKNENADIFLLGGIVYSNAQDVEWVGELDYRLGEQIGEVTKQTDKASSFSNGTANKLPVGVKIYDTNTPVSIAIVDDKHIPYLKMIEG
ncbi:hypothetical protein [Halobacillus aidingensis]|uniref:Uncharacterized protein n=1 Tax=Halobacillus aidingensis TaxID=240303 RepID=A0A1H0LN14_HALAD|nr:hypothetical protein [Halobacillus aidingensis]SDO69612.1 hypothetical protein SAMN05421677_10770 [Halobacillus aidingensis]